MTGRDPKKVPTPYVALAGFGFATSFFGLILSVNYFDGSSIDVVTAASHIVVCGWGFVAASVYFYQSENPNE